MSVPRPVLLALVLAGCGGGAGASPPRAFTPTAPSSSASPTAATPPVTHVDHVEVPTAIAALVAASDRTDADRALDAGRHPGETLAFFGIKPGMRVGELEAGVGYTTELLARAVAPNGVVFAENNAFVLEKFAAQPWTERLARPAMKPVVRVDRELEEPLPPEAHDLDAVLMVLFYHDTVWLKTDRAKMNAAVLRALRPGGVYGIVDHSGRPGTGMTETMTMHRIEEKALVDEVIGAGFVLAKDASFLRNPSDPRDWNDSPKASGDKRGTSDRFVLEFVKP